MASQLWALRLLAVRYILPPFWPSRLFSPLVVKQHSIKQMLGVCALQELLVQKVLREREAFTIACNANMHECMKMTASCCKHCSKVSKS